MKMLVCTDGSQHSQKALAKASLIAEGNIVDKVAIIYVYEEKLNLSALPFGEGYSPTEADMEHFKMLLEEHKKEGNKILEEASKIFEEKNIKAETILAKGHPAKTILEVASDKGFDMIVIGSRGLGGWKKRILGSVSIAVVQEAKDCVVVTVK